MLEGSRSIWRNFCWCLPACSGCRLLVWNSSVLIEVLTLKYTLYQQKCRYNLLRLWKLCKASPTRLPSSETPAMLSGINQDCDLIMVWTATGNPGRQRRIQMQACKRIFHTTKEIKPAHYDNEREQNINSEALRRMRRGPPGGHGDRRLPCPSAALEPDPRSRGVQRALVQPHLQSVHLPLHSNLLTLKLVWLCIISIKRTEFTLTQ